MKYKRRKRERERKNKKNNNADEKNTEHTKNLLLDHRLKKKNRKSNGKVVV